MTEDKLNEPDYYFDTPYSNPDTNGDKPVEKGAAVDANGAGRNKDKPTKSDAPTTAPATSVTSDKKKPESVSPHPHRESDYANPAYTETVYSGTVGGADTGGGAGGGTADEYYAADYGTDTNLPMSQKESATVEVKDSDARTPVKSKFTGVDPKVIQAMLAEDLKEDKQIMKSENQLMVEEMLIMKR